MQDTKERIAFLDLLKGVCLFGMILGHLCTWQIGEVTPGSAAWNVSNLYNTVCRVCVPVFLMISGYLSLDEDSCRRILPRSLGKAGRFGLTYLVWAILYALPDVKSLAADPASVLPTLAKGTFHLWYLLMLAGIYLLLPLLYRISRDDRELDYALGVAFVTTILLPSLAGVPGFEWIATLLDKLYLDTGFVFYFLLGYRLRRRPLSAVARRLLYGAGLAATLLEGVATWWLSCRSGSFSDFWLDQRSLTVALGAAALFVWAGQCVRSMPRRLAQGMALLSRRSLGIYVVHVFFLLLLRKFGISVYAWPPVWWLPLLAAGILLASTLVTLVLRRVPGIRNFV